MLYCDIDTDQSIKNLFHKLKGIENSENILRVTVLPDFFIDRIIRISNSFSFIKDIEKKISVGGGSIRGQTSYDLKGGNAVNVAHGLAKLGVQIDLYTIADDIGIAVLKSIFQSFSSNVRIHIKKGKHGLTTVFEFSASSSESSNIMISDVGDNDNFDFDDMNSNETLEILRKSNAVVLTNWASNFRGTSLMRYVFSNSPTSIHFIDPADIEKRRFEFIHDIKDNSNLIDFLSMNENEYNLIVDAFASINIINEKKGENKYYYPNSHIHKEDDIFQMLQKKTHPFERNLFCQSVQALSRFFNTSIIVHTIHGVAFSDGSDAIFVDSFPPSSVNILSGAGDAWDAAFLYGQLIGFTPFEKLCFANLVSFLYVENRYNGFPSLKNLIEFIESKFIKSQ